MLNLLELADLASYSFVCCNMLCCYLLSATLFSRIKTVLNNISCYCCALVNSYSFNPVKS